MRFAEKKHSGIMAGLAVLLMAGMIFGCSWASAATKPAAKGKTPAKTDQKKAPAKPAPKADEGKKEAAEPALSADAQAILNDFKENYICIETGVSLKEAEDSGSVCASGAKVEQYVRKMINCGWTKSEVSDMVSMVYQGEPVCKRLPGATPCGADGKAKMEFFIMSYCPYGTMLVDQVFPQVKADMGDALDWTPYYILGKDNNGELQSLHGPSEVEEDLRQICIREKLGGLKKWEPYFACFSENIFKKKGSADAKDWKYCAEQIKIDPAALDACVKNDGKALAEKDIKMSEKYRAQASPTTVYNCSRSVVGAYPYDRFKDPCVCSTIKGKKPAACAKK